MMINKTLYALPILAALSTGTCLASDDLTPEELAQIAAVGVVTPADKGMTDEEAALFASLYSAGVIVDPIPRVVNELTPNELAQIAAVGVVTPADKGMTDEEAALFASLYPAEVYPAGVIVDPIPRVVEDVVENSNAQIIKDQDAAYAASIIESRYVAVSSEVEQLQQEIAQRRAAVANIDATIPELETEVTELQKAYDLTYGGDRVQGNNFGLKQRLNHKKGQLATLQLLESELKAPEARLAVLLVAKAQLEEQMLGNGGNGAPNNNNTK